MYIGKVIGTVVATIKIDHLTNRKLLLVDMLDLEGNETGYYDIAVDVVQAIKSRCYTYDKAIFVEISNRSLLVPLQVMNSNPISIAAHKHRRTLYQP